jgi:hypothetical protein
MAVTPGRVLRNFAVFLTVLVLLFAAYTAVVLNWSYSTGERAGFLQKISEKGWICKTWEGELTLVSIPGTTPEKFLFSVRDPEAYKAINAAIGTKVAITYEQHKGIPSTCFGETEYFAVAVKPVAP